MGKCFFAGALLLVWSMIGADHHSVVHFVASPAICEGMAGQFRQRFHWIEATCLPEIRAFKGDRIR